MPNTAEATPALILIT
ncbi:hypothetical protein YPPY29_4490, partial [Yersinia pestis PY-29]